MTGGWGRKADLAVTAAGASGTHALLALLKTLSSVDVKRTRPLRIVIIDRRDILGAGSRRATGGGGVLSGRVVPVLQHRVTHV